MDNQSTLTIAGGGLDEEDLQDLTRQLCMVINQETDVDAELPETDTAPGSKGDPVTIGAIALAFITSKAAVELVGVLRTYFAREPSLEMELVSADGAKLTIRAKHFDGDQLQKTQGLIDSFCGGAQ